MATSQFTVTNTSFNSYGSGLSSALSAIGLVKVSGPTWGALSPPQTEVWRFNDALQATQPVYLQIVYGQNFNSTGLFTLTVGLDSGFVKSGTPISGSLPNFSVAPQNCFASGSTNRMQLAMAQGPNVYSGFFWNVERTKDASGNDTSEGVIVQAYGPGASNPGPVFNYVVPYSGVYAGMNSYFISAYNEGMVSSQDFNDNVGTTMVVPFNFRPFNPGLGTLMYMSTDLPAYTPQTITVYGSSHVYMPLYGYSANNLILVNLNVPMNIAMRWE